MPVQEARAAAAANKSALTTTLRIDQLLELKNETGAAGEVVVAMDESVQVRDQLASGEECEEGSTQLACAR